MPAQKRAKKARTEGWHGWDDYAAFYDWENARTLGRRDVAFWRRFVVDAPAPVLELGCGTGRLLVPMARTGVLVTGIDRSQPMLDHATRRARRLLRARRPAIIRGDIRTLPFKRGTFGAVVAAYGLVQSLLDDDDLDAVLAESARVLRRGGVMGFDLVPDLIHWEEYRQRVQFRGKSRRGGQITLVESVRQDRRKGLTTFDEEFVERYRGREDRRAFSLTFRTVSLDDLTRRLARVKLKVEQRAGDYAGGVWTEDADTWLLVARKV